MDELQTELDTEFPELNVQILGVNQVGQEFGNESFTADVDLPWLQDVDANQDGRSDAWTEWDVAERDVVIVDPQNRPVAVYNLTAHDLGEAENYQELKDLFVQVASANAPTGLIGGHVYFDVNDNSQLDSEELRIGGVTITLSGTTSAGDLIEQTTVTETDGSFVFQGLAAGTYTVQETQPMLTLDGRESSANAKVTIGSDSFSVQLDTGEQVSDLLFGERGRHPAAIGAADFLASNSGDGIVVAANAEAAQWYCLRGEWREYWHAELAMSGTPTSAEGPHLEAAFRDTHGHRLEGAWPQEGNRLFSLASSGDQVIIAATGELVDVTQAERDAQAAEGEFTVEESARTAAIDWIVGQDEEEWDWTNARLSL